MSKDYKTTSKSQQLIALLLLSITLAACQPNSYYDQSQTIANGKWQQDSNLLFQLPIGDTTALYDMFLNLRHNTSYPYANLYLFIHSTMPSGSQAHDTLELQLAQTDGKWLGTGSGSLRHNHFILRHRLRFAQIGNYTFSIKQGMRQQQLHGIENIGIELVGLE